MIVFHRNEFRQATVRVCVIGLVLAWMSLLRGTVEHACAQSPTWSRSATAKDQKKRVPKSSYSPKKLPEDCLEIIGPAGLKTYQWDFSRRADPDFDRWPNLWGRDTGQGYPKYVKISIQPRRPDVEAQVLPIDTAIIMRWGGIRKSFPLLPKVPPSIADLVVNYCLQVELDGGLARVVSPELPTSSTFQYHFSVDVNTQDLVHDGALAVVVFLDRNGQIIEEVSTERVSQTRGWETLQIEKLVPPSNAKSMLVRLEVVGGEDGTEDINGIIRFDDVKFEQFPQMMVRTDHPLGIYRYRDSVHTTTDLLGLPNESTKVRLRLLDHAGQLIRTATRTLEPRRIEPAKPVSLLATEETDSEPEPEDDAAKRIVSVDWELSDLSPGFYRLAASMENRRGASLANEVSFVVIDRLTEDPREWSPAADGLTKAQRDVQEFFQSDVISSSELKPLPFGWTLPAKVLKFHRRGSLSEQQIADWLRDLGVGWAKLPVWFDPDDQSAADAAAGLAFRLRDRGITPVGMLDQPPAKALANYQLRTQQVRDGAHQPVSNLFADPSIWRPQLDMIMNRMTLRMKIWQLGGDDDHGFLGRPDLGNKISTIASGLQGFGQPLEIVVPWPWLDPPPAVTGDAWTGLTRSTSPSFTPRELDAMLDLDQSAAMADALPPPPQSETLVAKKARASMPLMRRRNYQTWMTIDPIPADRYRLADRIKDLVLRMATVRGHDVQAAFVSNPMDPLTGLITENGHPEELLLPWRTASHLLGRSRNIGSLQLRSNAHNIVFEGDHTSVLMIWSDEGEKNEDIFLGDGVYEVDVWGRKSKIPTRTIDGRVVHQIVAEPTPKFIVGIDASLARFRMSVHTSRERIDSIIGKPQELAVHYSNPVTQTLQGKLTVQVPRAWSAIPNEDLWDLRPSDVGHSDFKVILGNGATIGEFELPLDFEFETAPPTKIRVYRRILVGPEGFDLLVTSRVIDESAQGHGLDDEPYEASGQLRVLAVSRPAATVRAPDSDDGARGNGPAFRRVGKSGTPGWQSVVASRP